MRRLPSLDSLRVFEAAARHLSFTKAAAELHVTQSALSHRIAALETELGRPLFRRGPRRLALTAEGERLAEGVRRGVEEIRRAVERFERREGGGPITVTVLPSVAARWLVPRLGRFQERHPAIPVRLHAELKLADLLAGEADVAIRFGLGRYPGLHVEPLMAEWILPVASPDWKRRHAIRAPRELDGATLVHDAPTERDGSGCGWSDWLRHVGVDGVDCDSGSRFNQADLALNATCSGLGVAMGRWSLVADDLAARRLVRVLPQVAPARFSYWFVCAPDAVERPAVVAFRDWLHEEARSAPPPSVRVRAR
jgi:LysR family glycine cleavage system transcriptional activator